VNFRRRKSATNYKCAEKKTQIFSLKKNGGHETSFGKLEILFGLLIRSGMEVGSNNEKFCLKTDKKALEFSTKFLDFFT
jgi:hypothetical protein